MEIRDIILQDLADGMIEEREKAGREWSGLLRQEVEERLTAIGVEQSRIKRDLDAKLQNEYSDDARTSLLESVVLALRMSAEDEKDLVKSAVLKEAGRLTR